MPSTGLQDDSPVPMLRERLTANSRESSEAISYSSLTRLSPTTRPLTLTPSALILPTL